MMMNKDRIYIAGPMRHKEFYNFPAFFAAEDLLEKRGWEVVNPAAIDLDNGIDPMAFPEDHDWDREPDGVDINGIIVRDVAGVISCDAIYLLPGWENSTGAKAELAIAKWAGLDIRLAVNDV